MMKLFTKLILINLSCFVSFASIAQDGQYDYTKTGQYDYNAENNRYNLSEGTKNIAKYIKNLGTYWGFDLEKPASPAPVRTLTNLQSTQNAQTILLKTIFGAIPVNAISQTFSAFLPNNMDAAGASTYNELANSTFKNPPYNSASSQQSGGISANTLFDQPPFQQDPVSQGILNILATPDSSYCMTYDGKEWVSDCQLLYQNKVTNNVIGTLPTAYQFFDFAGLTKNNPNNPEMIGQLNMNTLLSPLLYSTEKSQGQSNPSGQQGQNAGLTAQNQMQQAANFIRYASGMVVPITLPQLKNYDSLYLQATSTDPKTPLMVKMQAQATLTNYLATLRVYAAQTSVGLSNLYYILSKRMPQAINSDTQQGTKTTTSQALTEFEMATRRIKDPKSNNENQWINKINNSSSETVQKEIAILLSEINYQLYLNRQQEERILLTNSLMLLQNIKSSQPNASNLGSTGTAR